MSTSDDIYYPKWLLDAMVSAETDGRIVPEWPYLQAPAESAFPGKPSQESVYVAALYALGKDVEEESFKQRAVWN